MNRPSQHTAPSTSALPANDEAPSGPAGLAIVSHTPAVAIAIATSVARPGRSPSSVTARAADTSGNAPRMMPASTAEARCRPVMSSTV